MTTQTAEPKPQTIAEWVAFYTVPNRNRLALWVSHHEHFRLLLPLAPDGKRPEIEQRLTVLTELIEQAAANEVKSKAPRKQRHL